MARVIRLIFAALFSCVLKSIIAAIAMGWHPVANPPTHRPKISSSKFLNKIPKPEIKNPIAAPIKQIINTFLRPI